MTMTDLAKGDIFTHKHWLNSMAPFGGALQCRVTKIARGVVYYRPIYGLHDDGTEWLGSPAYFPIEFASRYVA